MMTNKILKLGEIGGVETMKSSTRKVTSKAVASEASRILRDGRYSDAAKKVAGSALAQARAKKKK